MPPAKKKGVKGKKGKKKVVIDDNAIMKEQNSILEAKKEALE